MVTNVPSKLIVSPRVRVPARKVFSWFSILHSGWGEDSLYPTRGNLPTSPLLDFHTLIFMELSLAMTSRPLHQLCATHGVYLGHTVVGPSLPGLEPLTYSSDREGINRDHALTSRLWRRSREVRAWSLFIPSRSICDEAQNEFSPLGVLYSIVPQVNIGSIFTERPSYPIYLECKHGTFPSLNFRLVNSDTLMPIEILDPNICFIFSIKKDKK